jgi:BON domain
MKLLARLIPVVALVFTVACGRTDAGITTDIKTKLAADDTVKAYQVDVDTKDHVVTLSGTVETTAVKDQAILIARQAAGVRDVVDNLRVIETAATSGGVGVDADPGVKADAKEGANSVTQGAKEIGEGAKEVGKDVGQRAKKGAEAVADGAKKAGSGVKDAVTDKDRDTDKDGK